MVLDSSPCSFSGICFRLRMMSVASSTTPGIDENSCSTPSIFTDRKSTRLNSSHLGNSYAVFCLNKKSKLLYASNAMSDLIMTGVLERYPRLKFVLVENEVSWIPFYLGQYDKYWGFFFNDTPPTMFYTLSLHDALPI